MIITLLHNHYEEDHLAKVVEEMKIMGPPTIKVYYLGFENRYQAIEGSHRLRACQILGIEPIIEEIGADTLIRDLNLDVDYCDNDTVDTLGDWENNSVEIN